MSAVTEGGVVTGNNVARLSADFTLLDTAASFKFNNDVKIYKTKDYFIRLIIEWKIYLKENFLLIKFN